MNKYRGRMAGSKFPPTYLFFLMISLICGTLQAQENSERIQLFDLQDVQVTEGDFFNAQEVALKYILTLEPDRLLAPFLREAGLPAKAESYPNWENTGLDGHIGGHYVTALSLMYASTGNPEVLERLEYMLQELRRAQLAYGTGYIGGVPGSKDLWTEIQSGKLDPGSFSLNDRWVPLYNIHKTYAGLLDAYQHTGNELALEMLVEYTDWMIDITKDLSKEQIQSLLISEHGGLNEVFAEVAAITGEKKFLDLAYNFSHKTILEPLSEGKDRLNGMHANTQIPKVIGFEAIAGISGDEEFHEAAKFFWETVVNNRTVAIGGNSVREHFHPASDFSAMMTDVQGPETCNTYNMLKLSKRLFQAEGLERYINYYEEGLYNHILSSQHPGKGGFVYFTPMRPGHYRVYSQPETSFWCCVGSGLENHAKYNELIYAHTNDELYVNLYIPSTLTWDEKRFSLVQETMFPKEEVSSFTISTKKPQELAIKFRYPSWVKENDFMISVNGKNISVNVTPGSYASVKRKWRNGDEIRVTFPMHISAERLPDGSNYEALKYGPVVLAAKTGTEDLEGLFADASRGGHIAHGKTIPLGEMPMLVTSEDNIEPFVEKISGEELVFSASELIQSDKFRDLKFIPFYQLHDSRYVIYLPVETPERAALIKIELEEKERQEKKLAAMTIDMVSPGEQQPESDHFIKSERSSIGVHRDRHWRDAEGWFSYDLKDGGMEATRLRLIYFGEDSNRKFKISVNGKTIAEEYLKGDRGNDFFHIDYSIPRDLVNKSDGTLTVKFEALAGSRTAGIYGVRLMKNEE